MKAHAAHLAGRVASSALLVACACGDGVPEREPWCMRVAEVVGGGTGRDYLQLDSSTRNAVVAVELTTLEGRVLEPCSGVLVDDRWVLTAAHCVGTEHVARGMVRFGPLARCADNEVVAHRVVVHPSLDLAALELEHGVEELAIPATPIAYALAAQPHVAPGQLALLAGYGTDELRTIGQRRFLAQSVAALSEHFWIVDGMGRRGACHGDSGGPLLQRDSLTGRPIVLGLLSQGDPSCRGRDEYTRVDVAHAWLASLGIRTDLSAAALACQQLDATGLCLGALSVRCEGEELRAQLCERTCGYDSAGQRFDCVQAAGGACDALDQVGRCEDDVALYCEAGQLVREACPASGSVCLRAPASGRASCVRADAPLGTLE